MKSMKSCFLALGLSLAGLLPAQDYRAKIRGIVTDSSQAVVAGAAVTLLNVNTGVRTVKPTNETGLYLFDYVQPGAYSLTVELAGFSKFVQENIEVQSRGDITVNAVLQPGNVQESITVTESPVSVQFNSTNVTLTIDTKLANELPRFDRNPFKLSLLNPAAVNTRSEMMPYHSWAANSVELGGGTNLKNDLQVDGSPIGVGHKASYTPPPDAVQEVNVLQNSIDAEAGHSAGGVISMSMKSGTNDWRGQVFYLGRNPKLNAMTDRTILSNVAARNSMWGGQAGHPIIRNKVFNFITFEQWRLREPLNYLRKMPTSLERQGDFSGTLHIDGGVKSIFDPYTTVLDTATNKATRTPFPGNRVPASRFDPVAASIMKELWEPNNPGENITGSNNFRTTLTRATNYYNISDRADWNISDKWRVYGRYSYLHTMVDSNDPTPNKSRWYVTQGASARHALSISGDAVWTMNERTVVNFHGDYHSLVDDFDSPRDKLGDASWSVVWPNSQWYKPYQANLPPYLPRVTIGGAQFGQQATYWLQHPNGNTFNVKLSQQRGAHYLKFGFDTRRSGGTSLVTGTTQFNFADALTAETFISPNTKYNGAAYATFLLGALDTSSLAVMKPIKEPRTEFYSLFAQDDFKLSRRLTLNLGLRYEYETPWHDPQYRMSRFLDLNQPIPEMQARPPQIPASATQYARIPYKWNGAWIFTDENHPGIWEAAKTVFMPRAGMALRVDDRTSLRVGYARYVLPTEYNFINAPFSGFENINFLEPPYLGFDASQNPAPVLQGIPQASLMDPFPSTNPLIPPKGKGYGRYLGLGGANLLWFYQNEARGVNERVNVSFQRQLPNQIVVDFTLFMNFGRDLSWTDNVNQMDPRLSYQYKSALAVTIPNPFYQYLTPDQFPGPSRNQARVTVGSLLRPYPQYGGLYEIGTPGRKERYTSYQFKVQRGFRNGYNFLFGYVYQREKAYEFFDDIAQYDDNFTYQESASPRHRISTAGTYEFPFGKGRRFLGDANRAIDAVFGGWQVVGVWYFNSGDFLRFGTMLANGDPVIPNRTPKRWFNTSVFAQQPPYTPRSNPKQYEGLTGPSFWDMQGTLSKTFRVTERLKTELKIAAYNLTNRLNRANPDTGVLSATFGQTLRQRTTVGRQMEFGLKILF